MNVEDYARGHEIELGVVLGKGVIMFSYYFDPTYVLVIIAFYLHCLRQWVLNRLSVNTMM